MGQKVSPVGLRIGVNKDWESKWYAEKDFATYLHEDIKIRKLLNSELKDAVISKIEIEKTKDSVVVNVIAARPGIIIGQDGKRVETLTKKITKIVNGRNVKLNVSEVTNPDLDAKIISRWIAEQLENRASFRTAQKKAMQRVMKAGAKGIKTMVSGRLGGADIARSEGYSEGVVPLHTIRADIDYAVSEAHTTYGRLGVKVWICRGEILPEKKTKNVEEAKGE
jgi:small subunit ribosomal protein S3